VRNTSLANRSETRRLIGALFEIMAGVDVVHVPYRIRAGKLHALAVTSAARLGASHPQSRSMWVNRGLI